LRSRRAAPAARRHEEPREEGRLESEGPAPGAGTEAGRSCRARCGGRAAGAGGLMPSWINDLFNTVFGKGQCCGWTNVVDVLIVAVFVYYILVLIRGTRAVQLLLGMLVLVGVYGIAVLLTLRLTQFVLQALFAFGIIAVAVVFQPELRRVLGQIGQLGPLNRLLAPLPEEQVEHVVDELVRAALLISEAHHGALIVVERATGLQDYSETGVPVNGRLTAELLASIFMTRSPLHD